MVRRLAFGLMVLATWIPLALFLGNRGEAFWILFPVWVLVGAYGLKAIPKPKPQYQNRYLKWTVKAALVILPIAYCYGMAWYMMARVVITEVLIAIWFFAASLELLLLYVFQIFNVLKDKWSKGRTKAQAMAIYIGGKAVFYLMLVAILLPTLSIHRVKFAPNDPPEELELKYELVTFPSRGAPQMELTGWFFPNKESRNIKGTVLACHGAGANRADIALMIMLLQEADFQVLCFDFRGHGESEGHTVTFGYHERKDVLGALDYLKTREDVDMDQIYGFGVSMGASSLLLALPDMPEMKAVVVDSPFSSLDLMVHHQYRFLPKFLRPVPAAFTRWVGWLDSGLVVSEVSPVEAIQDLDVPIFFIHGLDDITIPPKCANILHDSYSGPKKLTLVPGAGHCQAAGMGPVGPI